MITSHDDALVITVKSIDSKQKGSRLAWTHLKAWIRGRRSSSKVDFPMFGFTGNTIYSLRGHQTPSYSKRGIKEPQDWCPFLSCRFPSFFQQHLEGNHHKQQQDNPLYSSYKGEVSHSLLKISASRKCCDNYLTKSWGYHLLKIWTR